MYDLELYPEHCVQTAINAYQQIASISLSIQDNYAICTLLTSFYEPEETILEFSNYLLGISAKAIH